jgi:hypothetical protein
MHANRHYKPQHALHIQTKWCRTDVCWMLHSNLCSIRLTAVWCGGLSKPVQMCPADHDGSCMPSGRPSAHHHCTCTSQNSLSHGQHTAHGCAPLCWCGLLQGWHGLWSCSAAFIHCWRSSLGRAAALLVGIMPCHYHALNRCSGRPGSAWAIIGAATARVRAESL